MTREEAIKALKGLYDGSEAILMAIEALKHERTDEWCPGCKEYDTEKKCCPRFNRVIRGAMNREPSEDGTLEVKVEDATKVGRVLIADDEHRGGLYYPDEDEPQSVSFENDTEIKSCSKDSDLISRTDAIDALRYAQHRFTVADEAGGMGSVKWSEDVIYFAAAERVLTELPSADRPRGEWIEMGENKDGSHNIRCNQCGESFKARGHANSYNTKKKYRFCPHCGVDMRGDTE